MAPEDIPVLIAPGTTFRIRFTISNTGTAASGVITLRASKNGAAYTAVTTSSTNGGRSADASTATDGTSFTTAQFLLTAGPGTAVSGWYDEDGAFTASIVAGAYQEYEVGLTIPATDVVGGDVIDFELYNNTTAFTT
jgi:hypothetical protein